MGSLFSDSAKIPQVIMTIIAFSLSDTFDTIGTFIGTGRRTGIFSQKDEEALEDSKGFNTKMDKALLPMQLQLRSVRSLEHLIPLLMLNQLPGSVLGTNRIDFSGSSSFVCH